MKFYFAPMEGLTGYIYRNAHHTFFNHIDKYFSPFIVTNQSTSFKSRELNDILPENNRGQVLVPQLLTNNAKEFILTSKKIKQLGYNEINLNLGCPSGTVVSKNKGAGFLSKREELDAFFEEIFSEAVTEISVKTRIGMENPEEFYGLIKIFNKYPIEELIIHPRVRNDFYKNKPNREVFREALFISKNPVCYNGDIFTVEDFREFQAEFKEVGSIMIGRGLLSNPGLVADITDGVKFEKNVLKQFHDRIYEDYKAIFYGDRNVLFKMKELWSYMITQFTESEKYAKKIRKSQKLKDYEEVVSDLYRSEQECNRK